MVYSHYVKPIQESLVTNVRVQLKLLLDDGSVELDGG
jgi:hypothetical protein